MCRGNCKSEGQTAIETEWIATNYGQQLKFAVPEEGENVETVEIVDGIKDEIIGMIDYKLELNNKHGFTVEQVCGSIKDDIANIFNKYRK